ncbi:MAG: 3-deoxy-manno-octulosonate-8-phosphatase KdsC [Gammaproteobacteria bacterium]|nr:3-deoxy-manno-octulosonate-8-phosphatase KdsC [Gammaproteobacteria bacterium]MCI0590516.1 3-deoxy-manno-octulosonate-8-phosphatase KdsC [Gammaproteobacteria bacterium]
MQKIRERAARIRLVVFDVDGVLTDGSLILGDNGTEHKVFHARDGHGMAMLLESGVQIAVISGRSSEAVADRMGSLGIKYVYQGQADKLQTFVTLLQQLKLDADQVAYVGDDVMDLPIMARVGLAITVADGHELVANHADWTTDSPGGRGAAREVCELIMEAQGALDTQLQRYLQGRP